MNNTTSVRSVKRLFAVMEALSEKSSAGISELAKTTGLDKATVYRHLLTLCELGYAQQDPVSERYSLSYKLTVLAGNFLKNSSVAEAVHPILRKISQLTGETVHLVRREANTVVYIDKVEPTVNSIRMVSHIGMSQPLFSTGVGKAILAAKTDEEIAALWERSQVKKYTDKTITDLDTFMESLQEARTKGFAIDDEENEPGVRCVAITICSSPLTGDHAVSVSGPTSRVTKERLGEIAKLLTESFKSFKLA